MTTTPDRKIHTPISAQDANRIFQAMALETKRLILAGDAKVTREAIDHANQLTERFRVLSLKFEPEDMTAPTNPNGCAICQTKAGTVCDHTR